MFNSPINRLFGIKSVKKDNTPNKQNKRDNEKKEEKNKFFEDEKVLYTDISSESFDVEKFIRQFLDGVKTRGVSEKSAKKIDDFWAKFDINIFEQHYGKNLSKEDLSVILYSLTDKWGC